MHLDASGAGAEPRGRKSVTMVFCDVTGRTALGELLDPEVLRLVMSRSFDTMETAPNAITISTRSSIVSRWVRKGSEKS